ncbi:hypothetical protein [Lacticaseibacillus zhaodongensis]|uniref:hypothetical protein n=1 Tax=Lacticaseibacillus zhaodongensis TaxID=2668065 RepID=UPI0012D2A5AB|nr:hypothetical protein [Lacticaseibacillus zhaodongensis]
MKLSTKLSVCVAALALVAPVGMTAVNTVSAVTVTTATPAEDAAVQKWSRDEMVIGDIYTAKYNLGFGVTSPKANPYNPAGPLLKGSPAEEAAQAKEEWLAEAAILAVEKLSSFTTMNAVLAAKDADRDVIGEAIFQQATKAKAEAVTEAILKQPTLAAAIALAKKILAQTKPAAKPTSKSTKARRGTAHIKGSKKYGIQVWTRAGKPVRYGATEAKKTGHKVGELKKLFGQSNWKIFNATYKADGTTYYSLGGDQYIDANYVSFH